MSHHPPRKAYSTVQPPGYLYPQQQQPFEFTQPSYPSNSQIYPHQSNSQHQQYYQQPMITGEPRIVENLQFEPPNIDIGDTPVHAHQPVQQNYITGPATAMLPPHVAYQPMPHAQQMQQQWQQHSQRGNIRKFSLPAHMQNPQMMNYAPTAQPGHMIPSWNGEHNGIPNNTAMQIPVEPQRKLTPVHSYQQMLSPPTATASSQLPCGSQHVHSPALSSPMEVDRKPSDRFLPKFSREEAPRRDYKVPERKASCMAAKSILRLQKEQKPGSLVKYTPPPILPPMRNGSGLFWKISKASLPSTNHGSADCLDEDDMPATHHNDSDDADMSDGSPGLKLDDSSPEMVGCNGADCSDAQPARKNGLAYMGLQLDHFNVDLEALRKESHDSETSHRRMDERVHYDHLPGSNSRKVSSVSEAEEQDDIEVPEEFTDTKPHINYDAPRMNVDKKSKYQAKVKQWLEREIPPEELHFIVDRDVQLFNPECVDQLTDEQITAYENLACSQAGNQPGFNKELALHFLSEHRGNLCSAVSDVLTCNNTLDWEAFHNIQYNDYPEATVWTSDELFTFEDAMFEFKKDFVQIANKVGKTVRECVEFYYTWKKVSPDSYAKLKKNLRAQLGLEQALNSTLQETTEALHKASLHDKIESPSAEMSRLSTAEPYRGIEDYKETNNININTNENMFAMANSVSPNRDFSGGMFMNSTPSPNNHKDITGFHPRSHTTSHSQRPMVNSSGKKGAQPGPDGMFHCKLCDKFFEKVKSLNAHMKSHAMKARAEQEAKNQVDQQMNQVVQPQQVPLNMNGVNNPFSSGLAAMNLQQLTQSFANSPNMPHLAQFQNLLNNAQGLNGLLNGNNQLISQIAGHQPVIH